LGQWDRHFLHDKPVTGLLYGATCKALPVTRVRLKVGTGVHESAVASGDKFASFTIQVEAGAADIAAELLDASGTPLCGAFYVSILKAK
jgi:hypothetical protein